MTTNEVILCYDVKQTVLEHDFTLKGKSPSKSTARVDIDGTVYTITAGQDFKDAKDVTFNITNLNQADCEGNLNGAIKANVTVGNGDGNGGTKDGGTNIILIIIVIVIILLLTKGK